MVRREDESEEKERKGEEGQRESKGGKAPTKHKPFQQLRLLHSIFLVAGFAALYAALQLHSFALLSLVGVALDQLCAPSVVGSYYTGGH